MAILSRSVPTIPVGLRWSKPGLIGVSSLVPMVASFLTLRLFGSSQTVVTVGFLAALQAFGSLVALIADVNVGASLLRLFSSWPPSNQVRGIRAVRRITLLAGVGLILLSIAVGGLGSSILGPASNRWSLTVATVGGVALMYLQQCVNILSVQQKAVSVAVLALIQGFGMMTSAFLVVGVFDSSRPSELLVLTNALLVGLGAEFVYRVFSRNLPKPDATAARLVQLTRDLIRNGIAISFAAVLGSGAYVAQPLILRSFSGYEAAAQLRIATAVSGVIGGVLSAVISRVWAPAVARLPSEAIFSSTLEKALKSLFLVIPVALVLVATAPRIVGLFIEPSDSATSTLRIRLAVEIVRTWGVWFATSIMIGGRLRTYILLETIGFLSIMLFGAIGSIRGGAVGSVLGLGLAVVIYSTAAFRLLRRSKSRDFTELISLKREGWEADGH